MRIIVGQDAKITSPPFVDDDEVPTATTGTPTVAVVNAAGTTLAAPTVSASTPAGRYTAALTHAVHAAQLDTLTLTWSGTVSGSTRVMTQVVDVVGGRLFSVADLRSEPSLGDAVMFPTLLLSAVRDETEDFIEQWCGVAFNPRFTSETLYADNGRLPRPTWARGSSVRSIVEDGTALDASGWAFDAAGYLYTNTAPLRNQNVTAKVVVGYVHGWLAPPPRLVREALRWARREVLARNSKVSADVLSESIDGMTTRYALPDPANGRPTGILTLDPVLAEYMARSWVA